MTRPTLWAEPAAAAEAVRRLCPDAAAAAVARAEEICARTFLFRDHWEMEPTCQPIHFDGPVQWDAVPAGDPEWTYALNRHTIFVNLGRAWRLTGRVRYLDAFAALLADWLSRVPHTPASESSTWRALEAGLRPENWLRAAALFGQALPEELRCRNWKKKPGPCAGRWPSGPRPTAPSCRRGTATSSTPATCWRRERCSLPTRCWPLRPAAPCAKRSCGTSAPTRRPALPPCRRPGRKSPPRRWPPAATTSSAPAGGGRIPGSIFMPAASAADTGTPTFCTSTYTTAARPC